MKKLSIIVGVLCALTLSAWALASCPYPGGSAGGNGWNGGATQTYIKDVAISVFDSSLLIVTACDVGTTNCTASTINFGGKARFVRGGSDWHGSQAWPLRSVSFAQNCTSVPSEWCVTFAGDEDVGDHVNQLQNATRWSFNAAYAHPSAAAVAQAPFGHQIVKIAGMDSNPAQTLRFNYVNTTVTGIATKDIFFNPMTCP